ncbi:hypothetical protein [Aquisphaera giovannonii]|nr:hypothetical protein [Aquisphaera giovannonii]
MTISQAGENEVSILARVFDDERGLTPPDLARSSLEARSNERHRACMHDLAVRNQSGTLAQAEREELRAFAKAGTLLGILKSKARRTLKVPRGLALLRDRSHHPGETQGHGKLIEKVLIYEDII